jgi:hypothetical protein
VKKPDSLRETLSSACPELRSNPERLLMFIDEGRLVSTAAAGLSFEYAYTLHIILTDFAGDPDAIMVPLLAWVAINQVELLDNVQMRETGITFEADLLDNAKVDLSVRIKLTERVVVRTKAGGALEMQHVDEPQAEARLEAGRWELWLKDQLLVTWDVPAA